VALLQLVEDLAIVVAEIEAEAEDVAVADAEVENQMRRNGSQ